MKVPGPKLRHTSILACTLEHAGQTLDLDSISNLGTCAVAFDDGNAVWVEACFDQGLPNHHLLAVGAGETDTSASAITKGNES